MIRPITLLLLPWAEGEVEEVEEVEILAIINYYCANRRIFCKSPLKVPPVRIPLFLHPVII